MSTKSLFQLFESEPYKFWIVNKQVFENIVIIVFHIVIDIKLSEDLDIIIKDYEENRK